MTFATVLVAAAVVVNGRDYRYKVYVPDNVPAPRPVILFLHGAGERGDDNVAQTTVGITAALPLPAIVVMPQVPADMRWIGEPAEAAMKALDESIAKFDGDPKRVYLTGLSMGGYGTWHLALSHPQRFAALVPICGGLLAHTTAKSVVESPLTVGKPAPYRFVAEALRHIPIWIFHGSADPIIPVDESRRMADELRAAGANVRYTEYEGVAHGSWVNAYAEPALWRWLFDQAH